MSKLTRGLVIATTAATMFLAGCATQGTTDNGSGTTAPATTATVAPKNSCKGMSQCKGMNGCKGKAKKAKKAKKHKKAAKKAAAKKDSTTDSTAAAK